MAKQLVCVWVFVCALVAMSGSAWAQEATIEGAQEEASGARFDFEVDPIAYALEGHSLHVGLGWGRYRLDVGNFALAMPGWMHGQDDFDARFQGFGVKLDAFLDPLKQTGGFVGLDSSYTVVSVVDQRTGLGDRAGGLSVGGRVGWRFELGHDIFAVPWVGVGYRFGEEVAAGGRAFEMSPWTVFPTVHVGYRIR